MPDAGISPRDLDLILVRLNWLAIRIAVVVCQRERERRMSVQDLRQSLRGIIAQAERLTVAYAPNGNQVVTVADKTVEVSPTAGAAEIASALANPFMTTERTRMSITGFRPGAIKAALEAAKAQSQANLETAMGNLAAAQTKAAAVPDAINQVSAKMAKEADDALQELAQFTNGGPE